ncbi:MAG: tRNA (N(6)-L-threonylcarbamoyladenosine(37)-C(2))-methylthiotransferase MtaB, partial [Nitrospirae bacterium]
MKVHLDCVGCRLNQAEIELYARQLEAAGHTLVAEPGAADLAVVNTCAVTAEAAADSRQRLRRAARAGARRVVATGCWATLAPAAERTAAGGPEVVPNRRKDRLILDLLD